MSITQIHNTEQLANKLKLKSNLQLLIESVLLGSLANLLINYFFNPIKPDFILQEYITAFFLSFPIVLCNQIIHLHLDKAYDWKQQPTQRFFFHLMYLAVVLLLSINLFGNLYMAISAKGYFSLYELLSINLLAFTVAILLTSFKWAKDFYNNWINADKNLKYTQKQLEALSNTNQHKTLKVELQKGTQQYFVEAQEILWAKTEDGIVWVALKNGNHFINKNTLSQLMQILPEPQFFLVSRNVIVSKEVISNISPSTYGKVSLTLKDSIRGENHLTVSRPKAASFRKWFNSNSACN
ncbi:LytR/AlgR family response regulator transcription factor [Chondrinema litorale]|uniref:LytR/AlgR family response regulator transcription factor n=1 Tax=Chondrinema litorale TaxID=2994555 RepID=UPI002543CB63|nr:LytTR family DNA-binding domain-containing protein [Chondrinema litorale]UZR99452.1 LytTR family DNA-binding domain-containing protein [Chondrinema litorale]